MKVVSIEEMRKLDHLAQTQYDIDAYTLMTAAGNAVASEILTSHSPTSVAVVCGKGNNAGDGFVIAQRLHEAGCDISFVCLEEPSVYTGAALQAWNALSTRIQQSGSDNLTAAIDNSELIVDALLGTGISGPPRGAYADVIRQINRAAKTVVSVDIPSGLRELAPTEQPDDIIRATSTLTIGLPKTILLTHPGTAYAGRLVTLPINFPPDLLTSSDWKLNWTPPSELTSWLPPRIPTSNKGTWGHVGIVGSTLEYAGATLMTTRAALRTGCGLATIYTLPAANTIYKTALPEATSVIIGADSDRTFTHVAAEEFEARHRDHSILTIGPGLGTSAAAQTFLHKVVSSWKKPLLLDADALNLLADGWLDILRDRPHWLITPHPGEMARLTGKSITEVQADRLTTASEFAVKYGIIVLLKGADTLVARPDGQTWLIPGAEPALAKGGSGDVLTGIIASLFAQGIPLWQAAVLGAHAHLQAARACAKNFGSRGVLATEIANQVPVVLDAMEAQWRTP